MTNLAEYENKSHAIKLGKYRFIQFVCCAFLNELFKEKDDKVKIEKTDCMVYFLAWDSQSEKVRLMAISCNPWELKRKFRIHEVAKPLKLPPRPLELAHRIHLLIAEK